MNADLNSIVNALDRLAAAQQKGVLDYVHIIIVVLTLCMLTWYTIETYWLRKAGQDHIAETSRLINEAQKQNEVSARQLREAQRQNEVSVMPILAVAVESVHDVDTVRIVLLNVGSGPAFNLSIDRLEWDNRRLKIQHGGSVLRPGQVNELLFYFEEGDSGNLMDAKTLSRWMKAQRMPDPLVIIVRCDSVHSIAYTFMFRCTSEAGKLSISYVGAGRVGDAHGDTE